MVCNMRNQFLMSCFLFSIAFAQPGPLHIDLMVGEFHVVRSIIQYSIPKLIGWSPMLDAFVDQAVEKSTQNSNQSYGGRSPHNYQSNDDGGVPF